MTVDGTIIAIFGAPPDDLDLDTDTSSAYNIACGVFFVVAVACVILRFFVRIRSSNLWWDDYTIVGGLVCVPPCYFVLVRHSSGCLQ